MSWIIAFFAIYNIYNMLNNYQAKKIFLKSTTFKIVILNIICFIITMGGTVFSEYFANNYYYTFGHLQLYRLVTCMFYHYGIVHIVCNMSCLINLGLILENYLGKKKYLIAYFTTGILGGAISIFIHQVLGQNVLSAGASGAIMGLLGVYIASMNCNIQTKIKTAVISFAPLLLLGLYGGIDNICHFSCFIIGLMITPILKR